MLILSIEERDLLKVVLENAKAEVDASATPDATIQPDEPMALMDHYDQGTSILRKLEAYDQKQVLAKEGLRFIADCPRCESCPGVAEGLIWLIDQT